MNVESPQCVPIKELAVLSFQETQLTVCFGALVPETLTLSLPLLLRAKIPNTFPSFRLSISVTFFLIRMRPECEQNRGRLSYHPST